MSKPPIRSKRVFPGPSRRAMSESMSSAVLPPRSAKELSG